MILTRLSDVLELAPVIVLVLDVEGRIEHVNPFFETLTGFRLDEVRGRDWFATFLPERDHTRLRGLFATSLTGARVVDNLNPILTRHGEERQIEWNARALYDESGAPTGVLAIGKDVTAERRADGALRASEARLREAQAIAKIGSWELDLKTGHLDWSDEVYRIFEIDQSRFDASYETFLAMVHPLDRELVDRAYRASVEGRTVYEIVHRLAMPDGRIKHVREKGRSFYAHDGEAVRSVGTVQDITAEVEAGAQMHVTSELLRTVIRGAPVAIFAMDPRGVFTLSEGLALSSVGLAPGELVGRAAVEAFPDVPGVGAAIERALSGETIRAAHQLGAVAFEAHYAPQRDQSGNIVGVVGVAIDVSERRDAESRLESQLAEKEVLLREIHHRVKNNLQVVSSLLFLQQTTTSAPEVHAILRDSRSRVASMALVHEKLYSSAEQLSSIDLVDYARDLTAALFSSYGVDARRIRMVVEGERARADVDQAIVFGLILTEIVSNSLKHAFPAGRSGEVAIRFATEHGSLLMTAKDDGVGLPERAEPSSPETLGFRLLDGLAAQAGGALERRSSPGVSYTLRVPWRDQATGGTSDAK